MIDPGSAPQDAPSKDAPSQDAPPQGPPLQAAPPDPAPNLSDFAAAAQARLDPAAWAYLAGGAADEHTLRRNSDAWQRLSLAPRVLRPLVGGHTRLNLLGQAMAHPLLLAPVAYQRLFHPDGERASALAAAVQGAGLCSAPSPARRWRPWPRWCCLRPDTDRCGGN